MASEVDRSWATSRPGHRRHRRTWSLTWEAASATSKEQVSVAPMGWNDDDVQHELAPAALVSPVGSPPRYSGQLDGGRHEDSGPARASKQNLATSWRFRMHLRRERDLASSRDEADILELSSLQRRCMDFNVDFSEVEARAAKQTKASTTGCAKRRCTAKTSTGHRTPARRLYGQGMDLTSHERTACEQ